MAGDLSDRARPFLLDGCFFGFSGNWMGIPTCGG